MRGVGECGDEEDDRTWAEGSNRRLQESA